MIGTPAPEPAAGPPAGSALHGSLWTIGGFGTAQLLRLAGNLVLTRLLFPEIFGQMALVTTFLTGLHLFSDIGTGPAVIQSPRGGDPTFLNTAWTLQCIRGAVLCLASWAIAWPVASFYGQPVLAQLIPVAGVGALIDGFASLALFTARRNLRLGRVTVLELASQAAGIAANIVFVLLHRAWYGPSQPGAVWAIVGGGLVYNATRLILSHAAVPGIRHRFLLDREAISALLGFGRWVFVSTMLTFLSGQADRLVFGRLIPLALFGVYGIGAMLANLPTQAIAVLGSGVVFPALSRVAASGDFPARFGRIRLPVLVAGAAVVSGIIATGPFLVRMLYDSRYFAAGWILQYLAVGAWFQILEASNVAALLAQGRVRWVAAGNGSKLVALVAGIPLGFHLNGFEGALVGLVVSDVVRYLTSVVALARSGLGTLRSDLALTGAAGAIAVAGILAGGSAAAGSHPSILGFLAAGVVAAGAWGVVALRLLRGRSAREAWS